MDYKQFTEAANKNELRLSFSSLSQLAKSPRHFRDYFCSEFNVTPQIAFGSLVHCLVLEPNEFENRYIVAPMLNKRTKEGKALWSQFVAENEQKTIITEQQYQDAIFCVESLKDCKPAMQLLNSATEKEKKIEFEYKGLTVRGIVDAQSPHFVCDLKTTSDASPKAFKWSVRKFRYHLQAAIYTWENKEPFYIIALEKGGNAAVYELSESLVNEGRALFEQLILRYKSCCFRENWSDSYIAESRDGVFILE